MLLAAAYALLGEGPVDQLLWNPSYSGQDLFVAGDAYLPSLRTNVSLVQARCGHHADMGDVDHVGTGMGALPVIRTWFTTLTVRRPG